MGAVFTGDRSLDNVIFDDFDTISTGAGARWQIVKGTGATITQETAGGTIVDIPTAALANDYQLIGSQQPYFVLVQNKAIYFETRFKYVEASTNNLVFAFGLSTLLTTGFMGNTTAGPPASFTGACFYKVSGGLALGFRTSAATVNTDNATFATLVSGTTYTLGIAINMADPTNAIVTPTINDQAALKGATQLAQRAVAQSFVYTGLGPLYAFAGVKAGSAAAETLSVDYLYASQPR